MLVILVDLGEDEGRAPQDQVRVLLGELGAHRPELLERPRLIVGSRADRRPGELAGTGMTPADKESRESLKLDLEISAVTSAGLTALLGRLGGAR